MMQNTGNHDGTGTALVGVMPRPPAQVAPFVEALGPELAMAFILRFGGSEVYLPKNPTEANALVAVIGTEGTRALHELGQTGWLPRRIPLANRWLAAMMAWQGHSVTEIAWTLRVSDVRIREYRREDRLA